MKSLLITLLLVCTQIFAQAQGHTHTPMNNEIDSASYGLGINIAGSLLNGGIDSMNYTLFLEAIKDVLEYDHTKMTGEVANTVVQNYVSKKQQAKAALLAAEGTAFLAANKLKNGVVTLPSGLQYKEIVKGSGAIPVDGQKVTTHYSGTLINGKKFDSSYDRGEPATFGVNQVIAGWTEALKLMKVGSKWELYIPYNLAYGERGMGANIPPYSTLIFTIELLGVE